MVNKVLLWVGIGSIFFSLISVMSPFGRISAIFFGILGIILIIVATSKKDSIKGRKEEEEAEAETEVSIGEIRVKVKGKGTKKKK